ncbi:hypothetical protein C8F04DRAFT_1400403 [Mycena alexandri]|uniref:BTB domain-containing protein n=1 Tax=Mycena alexandri TaxID=1745969 RepID=A0AAD6WUY1_9AGAR|nr:hypothetical protein C8F04DRAFT_1400403 [Mycena alexandri]
MDATAELERSPDFWFEDGTIVLQAENMLYRVYRGWLASRSTVFRDTFSIPQPKEETVLVEGCPVVQVHDAAQDFGRFLKALHNHGSYKTCPVSDLSELISFLSLSDKYDVPALRDAMVSILFDLYPTTLAKWDARTRPPGYTVRRFDHVGVLNIAVKMNIRSILPVVMYTICCNLTPDEIVGGQLCKLRILDVDYQQRCIIGSLELGEARRKSLLYLTRDEGQVECEDPASCDAERLRWLRIDLDYENGSPLRDSNAGNWQNFALCDTCLSTAKAKWSGTRQALWNDLPNIFDLEPWKELLV